MDILQDLYLIGFLIVKSSTNNSLQVKVIISNSFSMNVRVFTLFVVYFLQSNLIFGNENFLESSLGDSAEKTQALGNPRFENDSLQIVYLLEEAEALKNKNLEEAIKAFQNAYLLSQKIGSHRLMAEALNRLGATAMNAGMLDLSVDYFLRLKKLGQDENNLGFIGNAEYNIGSIQVILEEYQDAKISLLSAFQTLSEYYDSVGRILPAGLLVNLNNNLGLCEMGLENDLDAITRFSEAIEIAEKNTLKESGEYYLALLNLADLYIKMDKIVDAERQLLKVQRMLSADGNKIITLNYLRIEGKVFLKKGEFKRALNSFGDAYALVVSQQNYSGLKHVSLDLSMAYEKVGNVDSALYYKDLSQQYDDEIQLSNASKQIMKSRLLEAFNAEKRDLETSYRLKLITSILLIILFTGIIVYLLIKKSPSLKSISGFNWFFPNGESINHELGDSENLNGVGDHPFDDEKKSMKGSFQLNHSNEKETLSSIFADFDNGKNKKIWKEFEVRLDAIDYHFYEKLLAEYPELTMNERRLAAFLKLQFSTKEISLLTGQSIRSIEVARSRLRKKLSISNSNQSLYDFFLKF